jgi:hypothetical protein
MMEILTLVPCVGARYAATMRGVGGTSGEGLQQPAQRAQTNFENQRLRKIGALFQLGDAGARSDAYQESGQLR